VTTHNSNHCFEVDDIGHCKQQKNITEHRKWEAFIGFCNRKTVKMASMMRNNLFKSWHLHKWSRNPLWLWILNFHYHIHKTLSFGLKSNQVNICVNIILQAMFTSLNWNLPMRLSEKFCMHLPSPCHRWIINVNKGSNWLLILKTDCENLLTIF